MFYEKKIYINAEYCDHTIRLGNYQIFYLLQNAMTDGFEAFDCGNSGLKRRCNGYWAVTKTKVNIKRKPKWGEEVIVRASYADDGKLRIHIRTEILSLKNELLAQGIQELCVLDFENHRPKKLKDTCLPIGENNNITLGVFEKFEKFESYSSSFEHIVRSYNIDMSYHVNNIEYIRLAMGLFKIEELSAFDIDSAEVHYTGECREGDTLVFKRVDNKNESYITVEKDQKTAFEMKLVFK